MIAPVNGSDFGFWVSGSGGSHDDIPSTAGHPGIIAVNTQTGTTNYSGIGLNSPNDDAILLGNGQTWRFETVLRIPTLSAAGQQFQVRAGFTDQSNQDPVDGCEFYYSDATNGGRWFGICQAGGGGTFTCDTGIAVVANTWYRLAVVVNSAGTSADFQVNGTSTCQVGPSGIAIGGTQQTSVVDVVHKINGTTARTMDVDYINVTGQLGTPR
jgi:hypothetical protein